MAGEGAAARSRTALLVALGVDDFGSGLFLPLVLICVTTVIGVRLSLAGVLVTAGTVVGLLAPALAGRLVDRVGPRAVVITSQVPQATGMLVYLVAGGPAGTLLAAALVVSALAVATWLPWLLVAASSAAGLLALPQLSRRLPATAVRPHPATEWVPLHPR